MGDLHDWNQQRAWHLELLSKPPLEFMVTAPSGVVCVLCREKIPTGTRALYKRRVGVGHDGCGRRAWGEPEPEVTP